MIQVHTATLSRRATPVRFGRIGGYAAALVFSITAWAGALALVARVAG